MSSQASPSSPQIEWVAPASDLAEMVHTFFILRTGAARLDEIMPSYSAQMHCFVSGRAELHYPDREAGHSSDFTINAPILRAAPMVLEGPVLIVGASFTPLGWASFAGMPVDKTHDTSFCATTILPPERMSALEASVARCRSGTASAEEVCATLQDMLRDVCHAPARPIPAQHRHMLAVIDAWLEGAFSPPIEELYAQLDLGPRQAQRLCRRYYGVPPAQLLKRSRAIRAAMLLANPDLSEEKRNEMLSSYFDQAHLIHDIKRYTGRTPKRLTSNVLGQGLFDPVGHGRSGQSVAEE